MSARAHMLLRIAAIAWIAVVAWNPWGSGPSARSEPVVAPAPTAMHASAWHVGPSHASALARR